MEDSVTAELFRDGGGQAVRLPQELKFKGDSVRIRRLGRGVLLEPIFADVREWFAELDKYSGEPLMGDGRNQPIMPVVR